MKFSKVFHSTTGKEKPKDRKASGRDRQNGGRNDDESLGITVKTEQTIHKMYVPTSFQQACPQGTALIHNHKTLTNFQTQR